MNGRHTLLIAKYSARYTVRGGIGLVFLLLSLSFGLIVAHTMLQPVEMIGRQMEQQGMQGDAADRTAHVLAELTRHAKAPVSWLLSTKSGDADPDGARAADEWASYLLEGRPAMLSAIFLILLFGWPIVVSFGAFDLYSGDIGSRQLRYQLLRADRSSIFAGRLLGMLLTFVLVLVLLGVTVTGYIGLKLSVYGWGDLIAWSVYGTTAMLCVSVPYIALCAWISASCRSSFASLTLASLVIGGVPLFALLGRLSHEAADYVLYLLPWGFQTRLFHPDAGQVALAVGGCAVQTLLFLWLGHRKFTRRDL